MTNVEIRIEERQFYRACTGGLSEPTALVELSVGGDDAVLGDDVARAALEDLIRAQASALYPGETFYGLAESDWPAAFLVDGGGAADQCHHDLRWLGEWAVALTVAIQRWGRDPVWRGRVLEVRPGRLRLAIPWYRESLFDLALEIALQAITDLVPAEQGPNPPWRGWLNPERIAVPRTLDSYFDGEWPDIQAGGLAPNTLRFIEAAVRRGMPFAVLPSFVQIGWGCNAERFDMATTGRTSWIAKTMARNKFKTSWTLAEAGIPVPQARLVTDVDEAVQAADLLGWPVVVKPLDLDGGYGVVPAIRDHARLVRAFEQANRLSPGRVLVEQHCAGDDHRVLVVGGRVLQVARRSAAQVVGDGVHTVRQLVEGLNRDPRRGMHRYSLLKTVIFDDDVLDCLAEQGFAPDSVPSDGEIVPLARIANIGAGGTAEDVTGVVHPDNIALAQRAARLTGLDIAGVDFLSPDISRSWREVGGAICEVNAQPGFRPHWLADPARDINGEVLDILFGGRPARVPTAAIAGTNGKTTTSEMLHRIWTVAGKCAGVCTTARVRIGTETVSTENLSGQPGARIILNDPAVEAAVLEMPRKGLIIFGHHCDRYDVAALLNVQDDHIGANGVDTLEQMAALKAEVLQRATEAIVVNAEDPLCMAMRDSASVRRHILVARSPQVDAVIEHRRQGGEAVFIDDRAGRPWIIRADGDNQHDLMPVHDIPATMNGLLPFNETNALFAVGLAWAQGIDAGDVKRALSGFSNTETDNPGRYNFVAGLPFDVLVDFAHNPDGVRGICSLATALPIAGRRVLCTLNVGSRHPNHLGALASTLAGSFDDFVVGCDPKLVGACPEYDSDDPAATMVSWARTLLTEHGVDPDRITVQVDRTEAILAALDTARAGDLVVLLADSDEAHHAIERWRADVRDSQPPKRLEPWDDGPVKRG